MTPVIMDELNFYFKLRSVLSHFKENHCASEHILGIPKLSQKMRVKLIGTLSAGFILSAIRCSNIKISWNLRNPELLILMYLAGIFCNTQLLFLWYWKLFDEEKRLLLFYFELKQRSDDNNYGWMISNNEKCVCENNLPAMETMVLFHYLLAKSVLVQL